MTDFSAELVGADGTRIALDGELHLGRSRECEIHIDDSRISRKHAVLRTVDQRLTLEDLDSANGSTVNGIPVKGEVELADGDKLKFDTHSYVVAIRGGAARPAAPAGEDEATVVPAMEANTERVAAPPAGKDLPGSWVDSGSGNQTMILSADELAGAVAAAAQAERGSDLPHLIVIGADGERAGVVELRTTAAQDVWEIGRAAPCEIVLNEPSVSERHAQLIHQDGRWRLVNLVSTNGIFVNGEKKLTAYLADSDEIRLGIVKLVFRTATGAAAASPASAAGEPAGATQPGPGGGRLWWTLGIIAVVVIGAIWFGRDLL